MELLIPLALALLAVAQGAALLVLALLLASALPPGMASDGLSGLTLGVTQGTVAGRIAATSVAALLAVNTLLLVIRVLLTYAIRGSYAERGWTFWLSWLADVPAAIRLTLSTTQRPRAWRGRLYGPVQAEQTQHA